MIHLLLADQTLDVSLQQTTRRRCNAEGDTEAKNLLIAARVLPFCRLYGASSATPTAESLAVVVAGTMSAVAMAAVAAVAAVVSAVVVVGCVCLRFFLPLPVVRSPLEPRDNSPTGPTGPTGRLKFNVSPG